MPYLIPYIYSLLAPKGNALFPLAPHCKRPVLVAPPAWIQYEVQLAEALAAEASLPQLGQQGFEERYRSAIVEYNKLFNHEVPGIDWWDHSDGESDLE